MVKLINLYSQHIVDGINKICGGRRITFVASPYDVLYRDGFYKTKIAVVQLHLLYVTQHQLFLPSSWQFSDRMASHRTVRSS